MMMSSSDLASLVSKKGDDGSEEIDEELLREMAAFSNRATSTNVKLQSESGIIFRKNGGGL